MTLKESPTPSIAGVAYGWLEKQLTHKVGVVDYVRFRIAPLPTLFYAIVRIRRRSILRRFAPTAPGCLARPSIARHVMRRDLYGEVIPLVLRSRLTTDQSSPPMTRLIRPDPFGAVSSDKDSSSRWWRLTCQGDKA